ncbi:MAG: hypothetical protein EPN91_08935 [Salinibacterium sp.]|nr:MAG: hypothetical protein EPN91_08935 [Salinibacterium sp.]
MHFSWRDGVSDAAQADLDRILDAGLEVARKELDKSSEFDPFALFTDGDGGLLSVKQDMGAFGKHPDSVAIINDANAKLKKVSVSARCTALVVNTRLSAEKTDAIEVHLEHREGTALLVLLPYKRKLTGKVDFGDLKAFICMPEVWG